MSKKWLLTVLVAVLLLLSGLLVYRRQQPEPVETETLPEVITLNQCAEEDLAKIVLSSTGGTVVLKQVEESWQVEPAQPVPVVHYQLLNIVDSFKDFIAEQVLFETVEDLAEFGLAAPQATATLFFQDGTEKKFYLGDAVPTGNGYYLMMDGDPRLFVVAYRYGKNFTVTATDLRDRNLPEIKTENLTLFRLKRAGGPTIEIKLPGPEGRPDGVPLGNWVMTKPYARIYTVNWEKFKPVLTRILSLRIDEFVHDQPADLKPYGLDQPRAEVQVEDGENSLHLLFGATVDGKTYFKYAGQPMVFAAERLNAGFLTVKPLDLIFRYAFIENIEKVDRIVVQGSGQSYELRITREKVATRTELEEATTDEGQGDGEEPEWVETFFVNGRKVTADAFRLFYQTLIGLSGEGEVQHQPAGEAEIRTSFYLNTGGRQPIVVSYVPYNQDFYAIVRDGIAEFVISRDQVTRMLKELAVLAQEN